MSDHSASNCAGTGKASPPGGTRRRLRGAALAAALAGALAPQAAGALEIERKFERTEAQLTQEVNALRPGAYKQVWIDIRSEPKVFNGRTYSGFISIHAFDQQGRQCRWDTAFEEVLKDFEPPFDPIPVEPFFAGCGEWSKWPVIDKAIGDWTLAYVHRHFDGFDGMPLTGNIAAKGFYYPDRLVLVMRLRTIDLRDEFKQLPDPGSIVPKALQDR